MGSYSARTHTGHRTRRVPGVPGSAKRWLFNRGCHMPQEEMGFDALLLCDNADLMELGLRKGARVKILSVMRDWADATSWCG